METMTKPYRILIVRDSGKIIMADKYSGTTTYNKDVHRGFEYTTKSGFDNKLKQIKGE